MLNPQSPIPLYRQLADLITTRIRTGQYPSGARIPGEPQLAKQFIIGRPTVRQAIETLVRKGLLTRKRGSGTFVCESQQEIDLFSLEGTLASFQKKGVTPSTRLVTPINRQQVAAHPHNPFSGHEAYYFSRLTEVDQAPVLLEDFYLNLDLFSGIENMDLEGYSLSAIAEEQFYLRPAGGKQLFSIGYAQGRRAKLLDISAQTPILLVHRLLHFPQTQAGVFAELWCRGDKFAFSQTIGGAVYA
ncbi:MAG: GntR family transcriptional regulator [Desulfobacteraceae bacterium]|nr:GntR family transcriptional regulator [Desulfobacteraceae bacterium]